MQKTSLFEQNKPVSGLDKLKNILENFECLTAKPNPNEQKFQSTLTMMDRMFEIAKGNLPSHSKEKHFEISEPDLKHCERYEQAGSQNRFDQSKLDEQARLLDAKLNGALSTQIFSLATDEQIKEKALNNYIEHELLDFADNAKEIAKHLREDLKHRLTQRLTMRDLDGTSPYDPEGPLDLLQELAIAKYHADAELTKIQGKKDREILNAEQSLAQAEKIILQHKLEFFAQSLVEITSDRYVTEEIKGMTPAELQSFRSAQHQLKCALHELRKSLQTGIKPVSGQIDKAIDRAENLYPKYKTDDRFQLLKSRLCEILG